MMSKLRGTPASILWQQLVRRASLAMLRRRGLSPEALLGRMGEEIAYWHLRRSGFVMISRNYRPKGMRKEIDLIGWDKDTLVFVEVKARGSGSLLPPEAAVDLEKQQHLSAAARHFRRDARLLAAPYRFDIVSVIIMPKGSEVEHFQDAFREATVPVRQGAASVRR